MRTVVKSRIKFKEDVMKKIKEKRLRETKVRKEYVHFTPSEVLEALEKCNYSHLGVPVSEREGVFVHSFTCNKCRLHFNVYSWKANKHLTHDVYCPECGQKGDHLHFMATINEDRNFTMNGDEIYKHVPFPRSEAVEVVTEE